MSLTKLDYHNARRYARQHVLKSKYENYLQSHPHIFSHTVYSERAATHDDFYVPPAIASKCIMVTLKWTELGCNKISCFPYKENNQPCERGDAPRAIPYGSRFTFACQPACFQLSSSVDPLYIDTEFKDGTCMMTNFLLKHYAINPQARSHLALTLDVTDQEELALNETYCKAHGLTLENGDCVRTHSQAAGEFFVGSTIYRSLTLKIHPLPSTPLVLPPIPDYLTADWPKSRTKRADDSDNISITESPTALTIEDDTTTTESRTKRAVADTTIDPNTVAEVVKELAIDFGIEVSAKKVAFVLQKTVPQYLLKSVNASTLAAVYSQKQLTMAASSARALGSAVNAVSIAFIVFQLITIPLDLIDPQEYNKALTKSQLYAIAAALRQEFNNTVGFDREITPEILWTLMEENQIDEQLVLLMEQKMNEYITALDMNAYGQRLYLQQELYDKQWREKQKQDQHLKPLYYHFFVTTIFLFLGLLLLPFLKYIIFSYLVFIIFYTGYIGNDYGIIMANMEAAIDPKSNV